MISESILHLAHRGSGLKYQPKNIFLKISIVCVILFALLLVTSLLFPEPVIHLLLKATGETI